MVISIETCINAFVLDSVFSFARVLGTGMAPFHFHSTIYLLIYVKEVPPVLL